VSPTSWGLALSFGAPFQEQVDRVPTTRFQGAIERRARLELHPVAVAKEEACKIEVANVDAHAQRCRESSDRASLVRRRQPNSSPESDSTPARVENDPACAASSATRDSASVEMHESMPEGDLLLAAPPAIPAARDGAPAWPDGARARRLAWAELMKRVFAIDVLECPRCRGPMRILATILPPETTSAILACMELPVRAPPLAPARCDDGFGDEADKQAPADFEP